MVSKKKRKEKKKRIEKFRLLYICDKLILVKYNQDKMYFFNQLKTFLKIVQYVYVLIFTLVSFLAILAYYFFLQSSIKKVTLFWSLLNVSTLLTLLPTPLHQIYQSFYMLNFRSIYLIFTLMSCIILVKLSLMGPYRHNSSSLGK